MQCSVAHDREGGMVQWGDQRGVQRGVHGERGAGTVTQGVQSDVQMGARRNARCNGASHTSTLAWCFESAFAWVKSGERSVLGQARVKTPRTAPAPSATVPQLSPPMAPR